MATKIIMPKNGMDMTEGTIVRWLKNVGDRVEYEEPIMEIETDKVTMESESPATGVLLAKYYDDGATVPVLTVLGYIGEEGEEVPDRPEEEGNIASEQPVKTDKPVIKPEDPINKENKNEFDVAVIGGGPAGYVAAIKAAQLGGKVILFEKDTLGGTCLNRGCIPTKTYLKTAEYLHHIRRAGERGIVANPEATVDMEKVVAYKNNVVKTLTSGVAGLLKSNSVQVIKGKAKLSGKNEIECDDKKYTADKVILCGGSKAGVIPIEGIDHKDVLTSDGILDITEVPERLCIIGGGVIGCELACAFSAFGSKVTVVELMDRLVANMDASISAELVKALKADGIEVQLGAQVKSIEDKDGKPVVVTDNGRIECDKVLLSIGRTADLECLGALKDEIKTEHGKVIVNDRMETSVQGIYAAGDINGKSMLAHSAFKMAETASMNAMGHDHVCELKYTPSCIYTIPEAASVGLTEEDARQQYGDEVSVGTFPLMANGRSLASGEKAGFVKVIISKKYCGILGVHIVGADAAEMIAEPAALMSGEVTADEVADYIIHGHPTYAEAFAEACADALGRCIHLPKKQS